MNFFRRFRGDTVDNELIGTPPCSAAFLDFSVFAYRSEATAFSVMSSLEIVSVCLVGRQPRAV